MGVLMSKAAMAYVQAPAPIEEMHEDQCPTGQQGMLNFRKQ